MSLFQKFKDLFLEPDLPQEFIDKWKAESDEEGRLKDEMDRLKQISDLTTGNKGRFQEGSTA